MRVKPILAVAAVALVAAACSSSGPTTAPTASPSAASPPVSPAATPSEGASPSAQSPAAAKAEIERNWTRFFNGQTPPGQKIDLLVDGQQFAGVIEASSQSQLARSTRAKVTNVSLTGPDTATVTYDVLVGGQPALTDRQGTAVRTDGTWRVSDASFCSLLALGGQVPAACPSPGASPSAWG